MPDTIRVQSTEEWQVANLIDRCRAGRLAREALHVQTLTDKEKIKTTQDGGKINKTRGGIQRIEVVFTTQTMNTTATVTPTPTAEAFTAIAAQVAQTPTAQQLSLVMKMITELSHSLATKATTATTTTTATTKTKKTPTEVLPAIPGIERILEDPQYCLELQAVLAQWEARSATWRKVTSEPYQRRQERFLWLIPLPPETAILEFDNLVSELDWAYSTASQYFAAFKTARATLSLPPSAELKLHGKLLGFLAKEEDPKRPTIPLSEKLAKEIISDLAGQTGNDHAAAMAEATEVSYTLGQRVGDTLKLETACCSSVVDLCPTNTQILLPVQAATATPAAVSASYLTLTFRKGKTVRRRQPYTLHLPLESALAQKILMRVERNRVSGAKELWPFPAHKSMKLIRDALLRRGGETWQATGCKLSILSIRRGGLQRMSLQGASQGCLLHHSRHTGPMMLDRYMDWGKTNLTAARELFASNGSQQMLW